MKLILTERDGTERVLPTTDQSAPDRALLDALISAERIVMEHSEWDCGDGEGCSTCNDAHARVESFGAEAKRREAEGISIRDADEPTLEERFAPFGPEWEREQREDRYGALA